MSKAYGFPKIYKENVPFKIIIPSTNTPLYALASFLHDIISKSLLPDNKYAKNSFDSYKKLDGKKIDSSEILVFLDVVSMFTNIPIDLAIDSLMKR